MKFTAILLSALAMSVMVSCGSKGSSESIHSNADTLDVNYVNGRERAERYFDNCADSASSCLFLLETRVNADELRRDSGDDAADNYIAGFEDYIRKFDPELAAEIL